VGVAILGRVLAPSLFAVLVAPACAPAPPAALSAETRGTVRFASTTFPTGAMLSHAGEGSPTTVWGELRLPRTPAAAVPGLVILHGAGGVTASLDEWAGELDRLGVATLTVDSFGPRGIRETRTGETTINMLSRLADAYRALELLAAHPRLDPARIAVMGFSQGGGIALLARHPRLRRFAAPGEHRHAFAAFVAFYPALCNLTLLDEDQASPGRLRVYHGTADDQTIIGPCRQYVARLRRAGQDVTLVEYAGAMHAFDVRAASGRFQPRVVSGRDCVYVERSPGVFDVTHRSDGRVAHPGDRCIARGITTGHDARAHAQAVEDVRRFLSDVLALAGGARHQP
jgi:dienelactone hydrolase